jgi:hypothetical protein
MEIITSPPAGAEASAAGEAMSGEALVGIGEFISEGGMEGSLAIIVLFELCLLALSDISFLGGSFKPLVDGVIVGGAGVSHVRHFFASGGHVLVGFARLAVLDTVNLDTNAVAGFLLSVTGLVMRAMRNFLEVDCGRAVVGQVLEMLGMLPLEMKFRIIGSGLVGRRGSRFHFLPKVFAEMREALGNFLFFSFVSHKLLWF